MELTELRAQLDALDRELLELFLRRMELAEQVAEYKQAHGLPVMDAAREQAVLDDMGRDTGVWERYVRCFFAQIMELSRARQTEVLGR